MKTKQQVDQVLKPTIYCDRDGCLNNLLPGPPPEDYLHRWDQFTFCDSAISALTNVFHSQYQLLVVSNQSGISRWPDRMPYDQIDDIFKKMVLEADDLVSLDIANVNSKAGVDALELPDEYNPVITDYMFCPHIPEHECNCRKPRPGMIHALGIKYEAHFKSSWMIGDSDSDVRAGYAAGIRNNILLDATVEPGIVERNLTLRRHIHSTLPTVTLHNLSDAIDFILAHDKLGGESNGK